MTLCKRIWGLGSLRGLASFSKEANPQISNAVPTVITSPQISTPTPFTEEDVMKAISEFSYSNKGYDSVDRFIKGLAGMINDDPNDTALPSEFIKSIGTTPYERESEISGSSILHKTKRINVTSVSMNKKYCELKRMYQLYSKMPPEVNKYMKMGTAKHRVKELEIHKQTLVDLIDDDAVETLEFELDLDESVLKVYENTEIIEETEVNLDDEQIEEDVDESYLNKNGNLLTNASFTESELARIKELSQQVLTTSKTTPISNLSINSAEQETAQASIEESATEKRGQTSLDIVTSTHRYIHVDNLEQVQTEESQFTISLQILFGRLTKLFCEGICREIRVVGHYDTKNSKLADKSEQFDKKADDLITLSGIIDQLELKSKNSGAVEAYKRDISVVSKTNDFEEWFSCIKENYYLWSDEISVGIRELKTRNRSFITQDVIMTANDQVSIYHKLLSTLTDDDQLNFDSWKITCKKRGINIERPLSYDLVKIFAASNKFLAHDFQRMKKGALLSYGGLDASIRSIESKSSQFSMPQILSDIPQISSLSGDWGTCPTLAHVIARLVQTMSIMKRNISKSMCIDFLIQQDDTTRQLVRYYNNNYANMVIEEGLNLWMGKREATHTTDSKVCAKCPFQNNCIIGQKLLQFL